MKHFTTLFTDLDQTTKTLAKIKALIDYFGKASDQDKLWAIALLSHRKPKRTVNTTYLAQWANERSELPAWLFEECYHIVGDLAETISLVLPRGPRHISMEFLIRQVVCRLRLYFETPSGTPKATNGISAMEAPM